MKGKDFLLLLFLSTICSKLIFAQHQHKIDSTLQALKSAKDDTVKAYALITLSKLHGQMGEYDKGKKYANDALEFSKKINYRKGIANAYNNIGIIVDHQGNYSEALKNLFEALRISIEIGDKQGIGNGYNGIGSVYIKQGMYPEALKNYFSGLKARVESGEIKAIAGSYNNIGLVYKKQGNYPEALKNYFAGLRIGEEAGDKRGISITYGNIGNIYESQGNYAEALKNHFAALKIQQEIGLKSGIAGSYTNIGNIYDFQGNYSEALKNYFVALKIKEETGDKEAIANAYDNIGNINLKQHYYAEALKNQLTALKIRNEIGNAEGLISSYTNLGLIYTKLKRNSEAKRYLDNALSLSKEVGSKEKIMVSYKGLSDLDNSVGNYKQALVHYKYYTVYKDSLLNEAGSKQTNEMKVKYESEKKEKEIVLLTKDKEIQNIEIKKQKQLKYSFIGGLGLVIVLLFFSYRAYRAQQVLRLQTIRNKIAGDLHDDIGSTLNSISIYSAVAKKKDEQQDEALEMIGDASRKIIDAMSDIVWTVNPDNDSFAKIIFRMKSIAYNLFRAKKIEFTFHSDEILDKKKLSLEERRSFYLIFKEAINNLVKYSNATRVAITLVNEKDYIKLRIQDDGVGFDTSDEVIGNGLKNMKRRADEMKAQFKIESSKGNGTQIELILKA